MRSKRSFIRWSEIDDRDFAASLTLCEKERIEHESTLQMSSKWRSKWLEKQKAPLPPPSPRVADRLGTDDDLYSSTFATVTKNYSSTFATGRPSANGIVTNKMISSTAELPKPPSAMATKSSATATKSSATSSVALQSPPPATSLFVSHVDWAPQAPFVSYGDFSRAFSTPSPATAASLPLPQRVEALESARADLRSRLKVVNTAIHRATVKWTCDVKDSCLCCVAKIEPWPPADSRRYHCVKGCNWDACAGCLGRAEREGLHEHPLALVDQSRLPELREEQAQLRGAVERTRDQLRGLTARNAIATSAESANALLLQAAELSAQASREAIAGSGSDYSETLATALSETVRVAWLAVEAARCSLDAVTEQVAGNTATSSRAGFLHSLEELVPRPVGVAWRNEWAALTLHWAQITNQKRFKPWLAKISVVEACEHTHSDMIEGSIAAGWPREDATCYWLLQSRVAGLSHALRDRNPAFSASLHALTDLLHAAARRQASVAPRLYCNLRGKFSLVSVDAEWETRKKHTMRLERQTPRIITLLRLRGCCCLPPPLLLLLASAAACTSFCCFHL